MKIFSWEKVLLVTRLALLQIKFYSTAQSAFSLNIMQVVNWSTWLSALVSIKDRIPVESRNGEGITAKPKEIEDEEPVQFNLLKATGDLLMLPKDILLDSEIRREALLKPFPSRLCKGSGILGQVSVSSSVRSPKSQNIYGQILFLT